MSPPDTDLILAMLFAQDGQKLAAPLAELTPQRWQALLAPAHCANAAYGPRCPQMWRSS